MKRLSIACLPVLLVASFAGAQTPPPPRPAPRPVKPVPPPTTTCFELSLDGSTWSKTPERLCVASRVGGADIRLESGMSIAAKPIAVFHLELTRRAKCIDCNKDRYALTNPSNSVFNALEIVFDGERRAHASTRQRRSTEISRFSGRSNIPTATAASSRRPVTTPQNVAGLRRTSAPVLPAATNRTASPSSVVSTPR
jgi:hypothetical protein